MSTDREESSLPGVDDGERVECPACGHNSECVYRCRECGYDLAADTTTSGRTGGGR